MSLVLRCSLTRSAFLLFFLSSSFRPTETEVVKSVSDCSDFLLDQTPPQIPNILKNGKILDQNRYKPICQTYQNTRTFLTLYDTTERIPVFSAIKFVIDENPGKRPRNKKWMIEPQLENESADKNMRKDNRKQGTYNHQASNSDYKNITIFNRGHVCPSTHASSQTAKTSTFTLTNIVPQVQSFNGGSWEKMETCTKCFMDTYCKNNNGATEGFVVTGAKPGNNKLKDHVNIPSMMWSAFCCYSNNEKVWLAGAHWGENVPEESKDKYLQTKTLKELYQEFGTQEEDFNVFPGTKCPLETTVTKFYPNLDMSCKCPPPTFK
ncbi:endonuclease domain-containing 1 protein [Oryzias melastigma]|uniref:Endonuclease domain-containing 1 protein-like n=1 Tax=Oryzias melastigma TaxID=30732 RepID=A0A3B3E0J4_ORYME|nr:endonuclease domain-containing 1 protein [Oryzias melastigma]